ncbi:hypothetical protein BOX15_Mlig017162g2 [Macrostomum lignano]|uniref:Uncharacterized protein n=1 Tax=Macrostomum lignano TaxID=282301 RepID=A0A267GBE2_9PLAT|nr:hypothetical protein BOX15_Mlig017162g2 [Macrostomum lignano]
MSTMSSNRLISDDDALFLQVYANDGTLKYWEERHKQALSRLDSRALDLSLSTVMLLNEFQIRQNTSKTTYYVNFLENIFADSDSSEILKAAIESRSKNGDEGRSKYQTMAIYQLYLDALVARNFRNEQSKLKTEALTDKYPIEEANQPKLHEATDRQDFESAITFITAHYVAGKCYIALGRNNTFEKPDWMSYCRFAHWLATQYFSQKAVAVDPCLANSLRLTMSRLMFNCAMKKTIYEHKYLVKAFQYFEAAIERRPQKASLIRRIDSDIIPNGWSITSILNMAACLLELRLPQKCRVLIEQGKQILKRFDLSKSTKLYKYFKAYADYVEGVSHFEDTCPLKSGLDCSSKALNRDFLKKKYELSKSCLKKSVSVLISGYTSDPLTASAVTMLSVVLVNSAGAFSEEALQNFEKAVHLECALESGTVTATYLLQILHVGANSSSDSTSSAKCKELYDRANSAIKRRFLEKSVRTQPKVERSNVRSASSLQAAMVPKSNLESSVDLSDGSAWMTIIRRIKDSKDFLDGYRLESLAHLKKLVRKYEDIEDIPVRVFCILCITRHYLNTQALSSAKHQQEKAAHLLDIGFGIKLDVCRLARITYEDFELSFPKDHKMLVFLVALWLVNEGIIFILQASEEHQKMRASELYPARYIPSRTEQVFLTLSSFLSWTGNILLKIFTFQKTTWMKSLDCLSHAKGLVETIKSDIVDCERTALVVIENFLANAFFRLDQIVSVEERFFTNPKLMFCVTELLKDVEDFTESIFVSSESSALSGTTLDLMICLHKAQVNFPDLLQLMKDQPYEFKASKEEPEIKFNLKVIYGVSDHPNKLRILQQAYDLCQRAELVDTQLYALIHMHVGIELYQQAFRNPKRPPYNTLNGAILKFRQAARIFELLDLYDVKTAYCYTMLSIMYRYNSQLDDQHTQCIRCLEKCLSIEKRLVVKGTSPSPWLWKGLQIVHFFKSTSPEFRRTTETVIHSMMIWNRGMNLVESS